MIKNMGGTDRALRSVVAVVLLVAAALGAIGGVLAWVAVIVGVVLLLTSVFGFCPLYAALRVSTNRTVRGA